MPPKVAHKVVPRAYVDGENFALYINHFNRVAEANDWSHQVKLVHLETKLNGRALREFEVFIEEDPDIHYDDITDKLIEELVPSPQAALKLFTSMRLDDKSPKEFYGALVRQSRLAHGEMDQNARHIIVKTQMLQVLPDQLIKTAAQQEYLADLGKEDFLKLITRIYDAGMRDERDAGKYEPIVSRVDNSIESRLKRLEDTEDRRDGEMKEMMDMMRDLHRGQQSSQRGRFNTNRFRSKPQSGSSQQDKEVTCYRCLKKGHFARECPNEVTCTKCRESGHMQAQCPKN